MIEYWFYAMPASEAIFMVITCSCTYVGYMREHEVYPEIKDTHPFNAKHPFNIYLCITILLEAFISIK